MISELERTIDGILARHDQLPDWEDHGGVLSTNSVGQSVYRLRINGLDIVVKPRDSLTHNGNHPRKTRIFQQLAPRYGLRTVPETVVEHEGKAIRVAEYVPAIDIALNIDDDRNMLDPSDRELVEQWFPNEIFNDVRYEGCAYVINQVILKIGRFSLWYKQLDPQQQERTKDSLKAVHNFLEAGFLLDLYGAFNFAFPNGEFTLVDVEPLQLSNAFRINPAVVGFSENLLDSIFNTVGIPPIRYGEIVKRNYGDDKFFHIDPYSIDFSLRTNVTPEEELGLYERRLVEVRG